MNCKQGGQVLYKIPSFRICVCVCNNLKLMITKDAVKTNNSVVYGMYRM